MNLSSISLASSRATFVKNPYNQETRLCAVLTANLEQLLSKLYRKVRMVSISDLPADEVDVEDTEAGHRV